MCATIDMNNSAFVSPMRGRLDVSLFTYLFIRWSSKVGVLLLCYHSISPCTFKGGIGATAICHLWRFILIDRYRLNKLHFAISVVFPVALISICCVMFTANASEVVDCGYELTLLVSSFSFRSI